MPIGTAFHHRTFPLCESLSYREWAGYYAVSAYETHHEHEYNAIRNAVAVIDVSPLFKYRVTGRDAAKFVDRVITRDARKLAVGQAIYTVWCDEEGKVIDDGTVARLADGSFRWTAADPNLRWLRQNAGGLDVQVEDVSDDVAALAVQGPLSGALLKTLTDADVEHLRFFRVTSGLIADVPVDISRTGYTGDLGYEIWMPWAAAERVWDAIVERGVEFDLHPAGMLALDVARIEAGFLLMDVDYTSSKKAQIPSQKFSPFEIGLGRLVSLDKPHFIGRRALMSEHAAGPGRRFVGLEVNWTDVETIYERIGLPPVAPTTASRVAVPLFRDGAQIGKATSTTWSPTLKKLIALGMVDAPSSAPGARLQMEMTVEAVRHKVRAHVVPLPFFNPPRKTATPV